MSTRCNIHFNYPGGQTAANVYRHSDGYPDGVLPDLERFFVAVEAQTDDTRFGDPSYLAAKFVVWQAGEYAFRYDFSSPDLKKIPTEPLDFLGVGVMVHDAGDAEYLYEVTASTDGGRPAVTHREVTE